MHCFIRKLHLLLQLIVVLLHLVASSSTFQEKWCGNITLKTPFSNPNSSSLVNHLLLCKSDNLYFRTSIGLFRISSINYTSKVLTVSHDTVSSASAFVSPIHLSAGFPPPLTSIPNSLILFNCLNQNSTTTETCNDRELSELRTLVKGFSSCSVINDAEKSFDPKDRNCSHYSRVYRNNEKKWVLGTRISYDVPDHVPNPCDECGKRDGNCGVGLRCVCHPRQCRDKVISYGPVLKPCGNIIVSYLNLLVFFILVADFI